MSVFTAEQPDLIQFTNSLRSLLDEAVLVVEPSRLFAVGQDPTNVALVATELDADAFEEWAGDGSEYGMDLPKLISVLGLGADDELVNVSEDSSTNRLVFEVPSMTYNMAYLSPQYVEKGPDQLPDLDWTATVSLPISELQRAVSAADMVSDHLNISVSDGQLVLDAGDEENETTLSVSESDGLSVESLSEDAVSIFSLDYLTDILSGIPSDTEVTLRLGTDLPLRIDAPFADGRGLTQFILAPRIQSN